MLFSDINFLLFLVPLLATLWIHEKLKWGGVFLRNTILLIASYWFYLPERKVCISSSLSTGDT